MILSKQPMLKHVTSSDPTTTIRKNLQSLVLTYKKTSTRLLNMKPGWDKQNYNGSTSPPNSVLSVILLTIWPKNIPQNNPINNFVKIVEKKLKNMDIFTNIFKHYPPFP